jgi:RHS repeat-associated protein
MEISLNDYESCLGDLPCDDAPVSCAVPWEIDLQNDWIENALLAGFFPNQTAGSLNYPTQLYRVRFCDGVELYLFHTELYSGSSAGGYKILQMIAVSDANQNFQVSDSTGAQALSGVQAFLDYRANQVDGFSVNSYSCDPSVVIDIEGCPHEEVSGQLSALSGLKEAMSTKTPSTIQLPQDLYRLRFCDGTEEHILAEELPQLPGPLGELQIITLEDTLQTFQTATLQGIGEVSLGEMLQMRSAPEALYLDGFEPEDIIEEAPLPPVWGGDPFGGPLRQLQDAPIPEVSYYIQDHLGNTRILYYTTFTDCDADSVRYHLEHVADYYPFGKILREYVAQGVPEKFLTTQHERDTETGLDYRGARFYDSEVGRFLSVDPLAREYAGWSTYCYTLDNPIRFIDPDGRSVEDDFIFNSQGQLIERIQTNEPDRFYVFGGFRVEQDDPNLVPIPVYNEIRLNSDLGHMARTIYAEAAGEGLASKIAVGEVIRNRANDITPSGPSNNYNARFSGVSTYEQVVNQPGQFESVATNSQRYTNTLEHIGGNGPGGGRRNEIRTAAFVQSMGAAINVDRQNTDSAQGATYFFSPYIPTPSWANTMTQVQIAEVDNNAFRFYRY